MENISLTLTLDEVNALLSSLGNQPYVQVFGLVQKIQQQASSQLPMVPHDNAVSHENAVANGHAVAQA